MKKIINTPETVVYDMCHGLAKAHPELEFVEKYKIVKKKEIDENKVSLISGGGSGHEPAHAGFVGKGMLDCAVCGDVFASPSQIQVYNAIKECATDKGVLLIIKNYSGDCMNFNNAADLAREEDGIKVDAVYVNDDIAVKDSLYTVGRAASRVRCSCTRSRVPLPNRASHLKKSRRSQTKSSTTSAPSVSR